MPLSLISMWTLQHSAEAGSPPGGTGVFYNVIQTLLGNPVKGHFDFGRHFIIASHIQPNGQAGATDEGFAELFEQVRETRLGKGSRPELEQQRAHFGQRPARELAQLFGGLACFGSSIAHISGSTSAIRLAEKSVWVTASCRSRARRVRSAVMASSTALAARLPRLSAVFDLVDKAQVNFAQLVGAFLNALLEVRVYSASWAASFSAANFVR